MTLLFHFTLCPASRAIRLALSECGIPFELSEIKPWALTRVFLNTNPAGTLPVLLIENKAICGAYPISEYLGDIAPRDGTRAPLWPGSPPERAEARRVADWFLHKFDAEISQALVEEKVYKPLSAARSSPDLASMRAARANLKYHLSYISFLSNQRNWLAGDKMSFADFAAAGHISVMDFLSEIDWNDYPEVKAWYAKTKSRPAFRPILADRVPGFSPPPAYADLDF